MSDLVYRVWVVGYDDRVGKIVFDGVRFRIWSHDHTPAHAHGYCGSASVVVELLEDGGVKIRRGSKRPSNAKRSDVRRIVVTAEEHYAELKKIWEETHG
jgi:hypothetical protein